MTRLRLATDIGRGSLDDDGVAIDEAYGEFAPEGTLPPIEVERPNLLRMRTFSKAHGLAGARVVPVGTATYARPYHLAGKITEEQMRAIPAKTMVIVGDADSVVLETRCSSSSSS